MLVHAMYQLDPGTALILAWHHQTFRSEERPDHWRLDVLQHEACATFRQQGGSTKCVMGQYRRGMNLASPTVN